MVNKKIEKRDFIFRATQLINKQGYHFTSIDDIAKVCGLSKASVYNYADSKQKLVELVLNYFHECVIENIFQTAFTSKLQPENKLMLLSEKLSQFYIGRQGGCLMGNLILELADSQTQYIKFFKKFFDAWINTLAYILNERLNIETARRIAEDITAQFQGALMMSRLYKNTAILMRVLERLGSLLTVRDNVLVAMEEF